jgi:F-type H+-transporting ATPase subunit epsilon
MAVRTQLHIEVVTTTGKIYDGMADEVVAEGTEGEFGVLPHHAPFLTTLAVGPLRVRHDGTEEPIFVAGGFFEVFENHITVLADEAEHAADIDEALAEEARRRAQTLLQERRGTVDEAALRGEIERALGRLRVAELHRIHGGRRRELPTQNPGE